MEATEDVGGDGTVRHHTADSSHTLQIPRTGIVTLHQLEDAVIARLRRKVDVLADVRVLRHHSDGLIVHILGVGRGKADADGGDSQGNLLQEIPEVIGLLPVDKAVGIDILPEERDLTIALRLEVLHLTDDAL